MTKERRAEPRFEARLAISLSGEGHDALVFSRNLSVSGAYLECREPLSYGEVVELRLAVPTDPEPIAVSAEVRWVTQEGRGEVNGAGVRARQMRAWTKYIQGLR